MEGNDVVVVVEEEEEAPPRRMTRSASAAAAKAVTLGGKTFATAQDLQAWVHLTIHERYLVDEELRAEDFAVALDMLRNHPNAAAKMGPSGVRAVAVRTHPSFGNRCLTLLRNDGSSEDFSAARCVEAIFSLRPPSNKQNRVLVEAPGAVVKLAFVLVPTEGGEKAPVPAGEAIGAFKRELQRALARAAGCAEDADDAEVQKCALVVDIPRQLPVAFVRMCDKDTAERAVAALPSTLNFAAQGWTARAESPAIAAGDDEKAFWERSLKSRELGMRQQHSTSSRGRGAGGRGRGAKAAFSSGDSVASQQQQQQSAAIAAASSSSLASAMVPPAKAISPTPLAISSRGGAAVLHKQAPRVTPTEGQTKRPATAIGTVGKPPIVVSKRAKKLAEAPSSSTPDAAAPQPTTAEEQSAAPHQQS